MSRENRRTSIDWLLVATLIAPTVSVAISTYAVEGPDVPTVIETVRLDESRQVLVLPGSVPDEPLQVEIMKGHSGDWQRTHSSLSDDDAERWSMAWREVLRPPVPAESDLWNQALSIIDQEQLPAGLVRVQPDVLLILRRTGNTPTYLSLVENHQIQRGPAGWEKVGDIDVDDVLSTPPNNRKGIWNLVFGQDPPVQGTWFQFWNSWIDSIQADSGANLFVYRGAEGGLVRVVRRQIEEEDWQRGLLEAKEPTRDGPVEKVVEKEPAEARQRSTVEVDIASYLLYLSIALLVVAVATKYRDRARNQLVRVRAWLAKDQDTEDPARLAALIKRLHLAAVKSLIYDGTSDELRLQALIFARDRMLAITGSGTAVLPDLELSDADEQGPDRRHDCAALGQELLSALEQRGEEPTLVGGRLFLQSLLSLDAKLAESSREAEKLRVKNQREHSAIEILRAQFDEERGELKAEIEKERRLLSQLQDRHQSLAAEKGQLEGVLTARTDEVDQLKHRLATAVQARDLTKQRASDLQVQIDSERLEQKTARTDKKYLEEKLILIRQASEYLRRTHLAYWDTCQHSASAATLLYNCYLGLFQALEGAARRETLLETAGWINLRNLLRRIGKVPGLEGWETSFGGVYPGIDSVHIPETLIVDRSQQDKERFIHSTVLQNLLSGELELVGRAGGSLNLKSLRGWPLYFKVENGRVWGAS